MTTLIYIPAGHMRVVSEHLQSDYTTSDLSPAKRPAEFMLISSESGREAYLDESRIRAILAPIIHDTCRMTPARTNFFPTAQATGTGAQLLTGSHPT
jgi:hypothetical protein